MCGYFVGGVACRVLYVPHPVCLCFIVFGWQGAVSVLYVWVVCEWSGVEYVFYCWWRVYVCRQVCVWVFVGGVA